MPIKLKGKEENVEIEDLTAPISLSEESEKPNIVNNSSKENSSSIVKENNEEPKRKLFANKKANIALSIVAAVGIVVFLALKFYFLK